jgi:hypothetical protein
MKRSKFTQAQILFILWPAEEGTALGEICHKAGNSDANLLQLAYEVRRLDAVGDKAVAPFNGKFRTECLNVHWLMRLGDASCGRLRKARR